MGAKKKLITLAKELDFNSESDYFYYIIDSFINGNKDQVARLFLDMKKTDQKYLISNFNEYSNNKIYLDFLINLL